MTVCDVDLMVDEQIDKVLTQYRESPGLLHLIKTYLRLAASTHAKVCNLPEAFDLLTAVGDQLTILGKRMGWPRCHCVCEVQPVFGFECEGQVADQPIAGFCDPGSTWAGCGEFGLGEVCIDDDEVYRGFLKARRRQFLGLFDMPNLQTAVVELFGADATVLASGDGRVVIAPARDLTSSEISLLQLYPRVIPVAPGVQIRFHFGATFVFGFGEGWGGFCEEWYPDGAVLIDSEGEPLVTEDSIEITTGPLTNGAPWMCEINVKPYSC